MKLKTFRVLLSKYSTEGIEPLQVAVEESINKFLKNVIVVDVKTDIVVTHRHNNGKNDTVYQVYSIFYEEKQHIGRREELLNSIIDHVAAGRNCTETIQELSRMGFNEDELQEFGFSMLDIADAEEDLT